MHLVLPIPSLSLTSAKELSPREALASMLIKRSVTLMGEVGSEPIADTTTAGEGGRAASFAR